MSNYFVSLLEAFGSSSAEKAESRQDEEKMEEEPESTSQLETQGETPKSRFLPETQVAFQSPAAQAASVEEPESQVTQPVEPFHHSPAAMVDSRPSPPLPPPRTFNSADEAAALAIPAPTNFNVHRLRSLSKVFTALPAKPLPTYTQMVMDQMEYLMHLILLDTDPARVIQHRKNLEATVGVFRSLPNGSEFMRTGRLYSRLQLTSLATDVFAQRLVDKDDEGSEDSGDTENEEFPLASNVASEAWNSLKEQLIFVKGILLRQNANAAVDGGAAPASDFPDEQLAKHMMMTVDCEEVVNLLAVHRELASLRERLEEISDWDETKSEVSPIRSNSHERSINKAVEKAVNQYIEKLTQIFPPNETPTAEDDDMFDSVEIDDNSDTTNEPRGNIPKELTAFVLTDLYSPKVGMVDRLLMHVQSITSETDSVTLNQPGLFSYANLHNKMRALLMKWSESILDIPTLVRLGYGGVPSPIVDKDEDDVSSWGGDEDLEEDPEHERRRNISRSRSLTRILNAAVRGQSVSVTEEEKDMIAQLAAAAAACGPSKSSRSTSASYRERAFKGKASSKAPKNASRSQATGPTSSVPPEASLDRRKDLPPQAQSTRKIIPIPAEKVGRVEPSSRGYTTVAQDPRAGTFSRRKKVHTDSAAPTLEQASANPVVARAREPMIAVLHVDSDSVIGGRRVMKAGRRLMASLAKAKQHESGSYDEEVASRKPAAKRKRNNDGETCAASGKADDVADDDSSVEVVRRPVKLSRRLSNWASKQRNRMRTDKKCPFEEGSFKENSKPPSTKQMTSKKDETPKKQATRLEWSDSESEITHVGPAKKRDTAYSPNKRHAFTQEETDAVRKGAVMFGVGNWKEIQESDPLLHRRTAAQVKDKYRTMKNRGEI